MHAYKELRLGQVTVFCPESSIHKWIGSISLAVRNVKKNKRETITTHSQGLYSATEKYCVRLSKKYLGAPVRLTRSAIGYLCLR